MRLHELLKELGLTFKGKKGEPTKALVLKLYPGVKHLTKLTPEQEQILREHLTAPPQEEETTDTQAPIPQVDVLRDPLGESDHSVILNKDPNFHYHLVSKPEMWGNSAMAKTQFGTRTGAQGYVPLDAVTGAEVMPFGMKEGSLWVVDGKIAMKCPIETYQARIQARRDRGKRLEAAMDGQTNSAQAAMLRHAARHGGPAGEVRTETTDLPPGGRRTSYPGGVIRKS